MTKVTYKTTSIAYIVIRVPPLGLRELMDLIHKDTPLSNVAQHCTLNNCRYSNRHKKQHGEPNRAFRQ